MERYKNTEIMINSNGKSTYGSTILPTIPPSTSDIKIISVDGDRLDLLAYKYYGDVSKWWIIALANNLGKGTMVVPLGTQLTIPTDSNLIYTNI